MASEALLEVSIETGVSQIDNSIKRIILELGESANRLERTTPIDTDDVAETVPGDDSLSNFSDDSDESPAQAIGFYIELLMGLVPSLQQARIQMATERSSCLWPALTVGAFETNAENWTADLSSKWSWMVVNKQTKRDPSIAYYLKPTDAPERSETRKRELASVQLAAYSVGDPQVPLRILENSASQKFRNLLRATSKRTLEYEDPELFDDALHVVPLEELYERANALYTSQMDGLNSASATRNSSTINTPQWGEQDCVIRTLLRWFKRSFFTWVNNPQCDICSSPTIAVGLTPPLPLDEKYGAKRVELFKCTAVECGASVRFPRYSSPWKLLQTRCGRAGEWTTCFSVLCRAVGSRVRYVFNTEDHAWVEVYSELQKRWIHVDPCEETWDTPLLYTEGWGKKISYCIAFSLDGATDVTRRYVRKTKYALPRVQCSEDTLRDVLIEIRQEIRKNLDRKARSRLFKEEITENMELQGYIVTSLVASLTDLLLGSIPLESSSFKAQSGGKLGESHAETMPEEQI